jgi:hypothetical protein
MKIIKEHIILLSLLHVLAACVPTERSVVRIDGADRHFAEGAQHAEQRVANQTQENRVTASPPQSTSSGLVPIVSNPIVPASQAIAICEPRSRVMASTANNTRSRNETGVSTTCTRDVMGNYRCNDNSGGGGFAEGFFGSLSEGIDRKRIQNSFLQSCLAEYGWR